MWQNLYNRLKARLNTRYRIEFIEDATLRQSYSFSQKLLGLLLMGLGVVVVVMVASICFVLFTPAMQRLIPGYEDPSTVRKQQAQLIAQLKESEEKFTQMQFLLEGMQEMAGAKVDSLKRQPGSTPPSAEPDYPEQPLPYKEPEPQPADPDPAPVKVVYTANRSEASSARAFNPLLQLFSPLKGELSNPFSLERKHLGIDIIAAEKSLIRSVADGYVVIAEYSYETGHVIGVMSQGNLMSFYKHNSRLLKGVGDYVNAGEAVAVIGNSGENSSGPHLHLEMWLNGKPVDPALYLPFR
jgi:murein DD-endopeptidase MepM/ murein hydrolase activator NlpD